MMRHWKQLFAALISVACLALQPAAHANSPTTAVVKKSEFGICHCQGNPWYSKTRSFTPFGSLEQCLSAGGRPASKLGNCGAPAPATSRPPAPTGSSRTSSYDRDHFGRWTDDDRDCQNTRHELLAQLNTGNLRFKPNGCSVEAGRWIDPYTNRIFTNAGDLDIDHLVPLAYAWSRGADRWSDEKRRTFANDPANLFAVEASVNRTKGAKGPVEWMPPHRGFHCQYLTRFKRVLLTYQLAPSASEMSEIDAKWREACS